MSGIRSLNGLNSNTININTINSGSAIDITSSSTTSSTCNVKISKQNATTNPNNTDLFLLEETNGDIKKIAYSDFSGGIDTNFWTFSSPNIYPKLTSENVLIGIQTNSNSRKLLVNGTAEITGNSFFNTISQGTWNGTRLGKDYIPTDTVYDADIANFITLTDLTTATNFAGSATSNIQIGNSSGAVNTDLKIYSEDIFLGGDTTNTQTQRIYIVAGKSFNGQTQVNIRAERGADGNAQNTFIDLTTAQGGTNSGTSKILLNATNSGSGVGNIEMIAKTEIIMNSLFKISSAGLPTYNSLKILNENSLVAGTNIGLVNNSGAITINATDTNTEYSGGTNITLSGTTFNLDTTLVGNLTWTGSQTYQNTLEITGPANSLGYINLYSNDNNKISLKTNVNIGSSYDVILPSATGIILTQNSLLAGTNIGLVNNNGIITISASDTNTEYSGGTNITLSGTTFNLDTTLVGNLTWTGSQTYQNTLEITGPANSLGYISLYSNDNNKISLKTNVNIGSSFDIILPSATGTLLTNQNTIPVNKGGTNITTYTVGDILYASGTTTLSKLAIGSVNRFLMSNGSAPVWALGYSVATPLTFTGLEIGINGLSGYGSNNQIITTTGSALAYSSTLTSVALSSCSGNVSQFTNDSNYLTSITTPLTTATNFGTSATGSVVIGKSDQGLNLVGSKVYLDYTKPVSINIISEIISSNLISYDGSSAMNFGQKNANAFNSNLHSNTVLNLSLTNSAYSIDLDSTTSQIQYNAPLHNFQTGLIKTQTKGMFIGNDNANALNTEVGINHSAATANGISFLTCFLNENQIGDVRQQTNNSVSFNTSSDYRLKTNIETIDCLELINKLKVKKFNFKSDLDIDIIGFIAHEVQETDNLFNSIVSGTKDEMSNWDSDNKCWTDNTNCECKPKYQSLDYGKLSPYNTRAIQELYLLIQQQQEVINEMKITIDKLNNSSTFKSFKS